MPLPLLSNSYALLIAGLLAISSSVGQSENRDPHFTPTAAKATSYMPRVIIRNMREDRAGNIWFATFGGPIRYDGKEFANFSEEVGLAKTRIFSLLEARSGALWFGSITGGASRYDGKSFKKFTEKGVLPVSLPESMWPICYGGDPHTGGSPWARVSMGNCRRIWCMGGAGSRRGGSGGGRASGSRSHSGRWRSGWPRRMGSAACPRRSASIITA